MTGRVKSICKFKEKQVADTLVPKRASATVNIKVLQIHRSKYNGPYSVDTPNRQLGHFLR